jgi:hypothetical protein
MIVKAVEIRDRNTFIPAIAIKVVAANEGQRYLLRRAGYALNGETIILVRLTDCGASCDVYEWPGDTRTMRTAHVWLEAHFDEIEDGAVVCVEHILGERPEPKRSEREEVPL